MRIRKLSLSILGCCLPLMAAFSVSAQHAGHDMGSMGDMAIESMPANNAVLATAPERVMLHFGSQVRLVKLALRNADSELLDIGFRYDPRPGMEFVHGLPALPSSDYYRVEWATLDADGELTRGNFHFSFGADARPPSYWLDQMEQMQHIMAPDYRLLGPDGQ